MAGDVAAECCEDITRTRGNAIGRIEIEHLALFIQQFGAIAVVVADAELFRGAGDDQADLVERGLQCSLEACGVQPQAGVNRPFAAADPRCDRFGIGHLGNTRRADERAAADFVQARVSQRFDEGDLVFGGYTRRLALDALARPLLDDLHLAGDVAHGLAPIVRSTRACASR